MRQAFYSLRPDIPCYDYLRAALTSMCSKLSFCQGPNLNNIFSEDEVDAEASNLTKKKQNPTPRDSKTPTLKFWNFVLWQEAFLKKNAFAGHECGKSKKQKKGMILSHRTEFANYY